MGPTPRPPLRILHIQESDSEKVVAFSPSVETSGPPASKNLERRDHRGRRRKKHGSKQAAEKVVDWVTGDGVAASKRTCADTMSSKVACSVTFRRRSGYRKIIRCDGYEG